VKIDCPASEGTEPHGISTSICRSLNYSGLGLFAVAIQIYEFEAREYADATQRRVATQKDAIQRMMAAVQAL
jgi:hypothetical protein